MRSRTWGSQCYAVNVQICYSDPCIVFNELESIVHVIQGLSLSTASLVQTIKKILDFTKASCTQILMDHQNWRVQKHFF